VFITSVTDKTDLRPETALAEPARLDANDVRTPLATAIVTPIMTTTGTNVSAMPRNRASAGDVTADLHAEVEDRLRRIDQRYTSGRRAIVGLLVGAGHPVSIDDIADHLPALPRSSAYRHLVDLQTAGIVRRVAANDEFTRFELAEDLTEHHHHFLCTNCGRVSDITPSVALERSITQQLDRLAEAQGFEPHSHRVDVLGICASCQ
jgi:Fe2+ or Zn2+ uptake regulation protein